MKQLQAFANVASEPSPLLVTFVIFLITLLPQPSKNLVASMSG
jgi:hypothetical protein